MTSRLFVIAWKELLQLRRDPLTLAMVVVFPLVQLALFGYAINTDVRHIPTVVYDQDRSFESRDLTRALEATGFYDLAGFVESYADIERSLRTGRARAALVIPAEFAAEKGAGRPVQVQLVVDGSDPQIVASATNTAVSLLTARSMSLLLSRLDAGGHQLTDPVSLEVSTWYNPDLRTAVYVVPGLIGVILTMTMVMLTAMAIARERERGTLEQLIVSPVKKLELIVGKIVPYVSIGYVQMTLVLIAGHLVFRVPFVGSILLLYVTALLFISANLALGLFFSTLAKTQQQAMQMSFFFLLPNILLSGFMFPFEAMPRPAQWLAQVLPLTHFLRVVRGITLKGATMNDVLPELFPLLGVLVLLVVVAAARFSKRLA